MKRAIPLILLLFLSQTNTFCQYTFTGFVVDSTTQETLAAVNVVPSSGNGTLTNDLGQFMFTASVTNVNVTFSFIGLKTKTVMLSNTRADTIRLQVDEEQEEPNHYAKASLNAGYFGDMVYAPSGVLVSASIQSIGKTDFHTTAILKYSNYRDNKILDLSVNRYFRSPIVPINIFMSYRKIDYPRQSFELQQYRGIIAAILPRSFGIDLGAVFNRGNYGDLLVGNNKKYTLTHVGLSKSFEHFNRWYFGLYGSVSYHNSLRFYDVGLYKPFSIAKVYMNATVRYFNYEALEGVLVGISFTLFSTKYYCCYSHLVSGVLLNELK